MPKSYARSMIIFHFIFALMISAMASSAVPMKDNILFAFEKCKTLAVDLEKGQLAETVTSSFDLHCRQTPGNPLEYKCDYFDTGSNKKLGQEMFTGGSNLGKAELTDRNGRKLRFLIGKNFAAYESGPEQKVCAGIFIFEQDALKQQSSSPKSGL